jgi:hypothetical protein
LSARQLSARHGIPSLLSQNVVLFFTPSGWHAENGSAWERGDFVLKIRAELPGSVEKSGGRDSRLNVVCRLSQQDFLKPATIVGRGENIALHTLIRGMTGKVRDTPQSRRYRCNRLAQHRFRLALTTPRDGRLVRCENDNIGVEREVLCPVMLRQHVRPTMETK